MIQRVRYNGGKQEKRSSPPENLLGSCSRIFAESERQIARGGGRGGAGLRNEKDFQYDAYPL